MTARPDRLTRAQVRNVVLFAASMGTALVVLSRPPWSVAWLRWATYFTTFGAVGAWLLRVVAWARARWASPRAAFRANGPEILLATGAMALLFATHDWQFKVLADEANFVAVGRALSFEWRFEVGDEAKFFWGGQHFLSYFFDKRPPLFTFVLSLVDSVTGYRVNNVWYLNGALFGATVAVAAGALRRRLGRPWNLLAVVWAVANPIVIQTGSAAGVEQLLCFMWAVGGVLLLEALEAPDSPSVPLLVATVLLLALTRAEAGPMGVLMLAAMIVASKDRRQLLRRVSDDWLVWCTPIAVLPIAIVKVHGTGYFQGEKHPFGLRYAKENVANWARVLTDGGLHSPFNGVVTVTEVVAFVVLVGLVLARRTKMSKAEATAFWIFSALTAAFVAIYSVYFWGQPNKSTSARFYALPFFFAGLCVPVVLRRVQGLGSRPVLAGVLFGVVFAHAVPGLQNTAFVNSLGWRKSHRIVEEYLLPRIHGHNILLVTDIAAQYTIYDVSAITVQRFNRERQTILRELDHHLYDEILFLEDVNLEDGKPIAMHRRDPEVKMETVLERQYGPQTSLRISRLVPEAAPANASPPNEEPSKAPASKEPVSEEPAGEEPASSH